MITDMTEAQLVAAGYEDVLPGEHVLVVYCAVPTLTPLGSRGERWVLSYELDTIRFFRSSLGSYEAPWLRDALTWARKQPDPAASLRGLQAAYLLAGGDSSAGGTEAFMEVVYGPDSPEVVKGSGVSAGIRAAQRRRRRWV